MKKTLFLLLSVLLALSLVLVTVSCESQVNGSKAEEKSNEETKKNEEKGEDFTDDVVKALETKNQVVFTNLEGVLKSVSNAFKNGSFEEAKIDATLGFKADGGVAITTKEEINASDNTRTAVPSKYKSIEAAASMKKGSTGSTSSIVFNYTKNGDTTATEWTYGSGSDDDPLCYEAIAAWNAVAENTSDKSGKTSTETINCAALFRKVSKIAAGGIDFDGNATLDLSGNSDIAINYDVTLTGSADGNTLVVDVTKLEGKMGTKTLFSVKGKFTLTLSSNFTLTYVDVRDNDTMVHSKDWNFGSGSSISAVVEDLEVSFDKCVFSGNAKGSVAFGKNDSKTITVEKLALTETIDGSKYAELDAAYKQTISGDEIDLDDFINGLTINKFSVDGTTYSPKTIKAYIKATIEAYIASQSEKQ